MSEWPQPAGNGRFVILFMVGFTLIGSEYTFYFLAAFGRMRVEGQRFGIGDGCHEAGIVDEDDGGRKDPSAMPSQDTATGPGQVCTLAP